MCKTPPAGCSVLGSSMGSLSGLMTRLARVIFSLPMHCVFGRTLLFGCWEKTHIPRGNWGQFPPCVPPAKGTGASMALQLCVKGGIGKLDTFSIFLFNLTSHGTQYETPNAREGRWGDPKAAAVSGRSCGRGVRVMAEPALQTPPPLAESPRLTRGESC